MALVDQQVDAIDENVRSPPSGPAGPTTFFLVAESIPRVKHDRVSSRDAYMASEKDNRSAGGFQAAGIQRRFERARA